MMRIAILGSLASAMLCSRSSRHLKPYLTGMPDRTKAHMTDTAPEESPALVNLSLAGATAVTFAVSGEVSHGPMWPTEPRATAGTVGVGSKYSQSRSGYIGS